MRGRKDEQPALFHTFNVEERIRPDHPLRDVKRRVDRILETIAPDFVRAYSRTGRPKTLGADKGYDSGGEIKGDANLFRGAASGAGRPVLVR